MPFRSEAQRRFMFARHPEIAKRWAQEYPNQGPLPRHAKHKTKHHAQIAKFVKRHHGGQHG
jgi:hypothetical protein